MLIRSFGLQKNKDFCNINTKIEYKALQLVNNA